MEKTNVKYKNSELVSILNAHFKGKVNLARIKLISFFIIALIKVLTVNFEKLSHAFNTKTKSASSLRRIQGFIAEYVFDSNLIARLFGFDIIEAIVADREFVGEKWFEYLNKNQIRYYIRIR